MIRSIFLATLIFIQPVLVHAGIYRWTDEAGNVHFSDKPVSEKATEVKVKVRPSLPVNKQTLEKRRLRTEQYLRGREQERAEIDKQQKEKKQFRKKRKRKCLTAQKEYGRMSRARTIYYKGKDGARDYVGDNQRTKLLAAAKADIKRWCK